MREDAQQGTVLSKASWKGRGQAESENTNRSVPGREAHRIYTEAQRQGVLGGMAGL